MEVARGQEGGALLLWGEHDWEDEKGLEMEGGRV